MYHTPHHSRPVSALHPAVAVSIDEARGRTRATAELCWNGSYLAGHGVAYRHPSDHLTREAGQELATARALSDLARQVRAPRRVTV